MEQRGANLKCQVKNIRIALLLQEGETIHATIAERLKIDRSVLKIVSKGQIRDEEEAMREWKKDPQQVFFVVGSAGKQREIPEEKNAVAAAKSRESVERFQEWQRAEQQRLAAQRANRSTVTCARRTELALQRATEVVSNNSVARLAWGVVGVASLFVSSLFRPFAMEEEEVSRARAAAQDREGPAPRRPMGGVRRPESHSGAGGG